MCESACRISIDRWAQAGENYWAGQAVDPSLTSRGTPRACGNLHMAGLAG